MTRFWYPFLLTVIALMGAAARADDLSVEAFLSDVKAKNPEVRGAVQSAEGSRLRSEERNVLTSFSLFADGQYASDAKLPQIALFTYDRIINQNYNLGVKKLTSYGQEMKLYYNVSHVNFVNVQLPGGTGGAATSFYDARPVFELTQKLWSDGFGRSTRASHDAMEAGALATSFASSFQAKAALVSAEEAYWRLALARERVTVQRTALEQARKIHQWSANRAKNRLGDEADALQAKAALDVRELEMQAAVDEERMASRAFNRVRYREGDSVPETLVEVDVQKLLSSSPGKREEKRDDVKAAEQQSKAAIAQGTVTSERNQPQLDLTGSVALNGRSVELGKALGDPYGAGRPTYALGMKFSMPLDRGTVSDVQRGLAQEQKAAELTYQHKLAQQERDWTELGQRLEEGKKRLALSVRITEAQAAKLNHERTRLRQGRTTTFQVLQFEQDFAQAQLAQIRAEAEVVGITTQMKLFGGSL